MQRFFLARAGKVDGPFTEKELATQAVHYSWIWKPGAKTWEPLDPPPAPMSEFENRAKKFSKREISAVCHNQRIAISGALRDITDAGATLFAAQYSPDLPLSGRVELNLVDPSSGRAENIRARLTQVERLEGQWSYRLSWRKAPDIL